MLQAAQEAVGAFDLPFDFEGALRSHQNVEVEGLQVRGFLLEPLVLGEFVLEVDCEVVQFSLLIEDHLQVQLVDALLAVAVCIEQIDDLVLVDFGRVNRDRGQVFDSARRPLGIEEFHGCKLGFAFLINLIDTLKDVPSSLRRFRSPCVRKAAFEHCDSDGGVCAEEASAVSEG